mgnify:CR=1 FL=1
MTDDTTGITNGTPDDGTTETTHEPMRRHLHVVPAYRPSTDGVMRLANLGPYTTELGGHLPNSPANMAAVIRAPEKFAPGTTMPNLGVSEPHARDMVAYLQGLGTAVKRGN